VFSEDGATIDVSKYSEEELVYQGGTVYPLIIVAEIDVSELPETLSNEHIISKQTTLATLCKNGDGVWEVKALQQKVLYQGFTYVVYDIYGIEQSLSTTAEECVICLTEMRDTVVIPCRHMCVCHQCAQVLRFQSYKCPICRGAVRSMLKIKVSKNGDKKTSSEDGNQMNNVDDEEDEVLLKRSKRKKIVMETDSEGESITV